MGVKVREKIKDSGIYWVFVAHQGRRTSRKVGDRKAAREAARKIQARLTLGAAAFPEKKSLRPLHSQLIVNASKRTICQEH